MNSIVFYCNKDDTRKVSKSLERIYEFNGTIKLLDDCSVENPHFIIQPHDIDNAMAKCNYMKIADFKRYYNCDITLKNGGLLEIRGKVDVLKSFDEQIRNINTYVERQEFRYNANFNDPSLPIRTDTNYRVYGFGQIPSAYKYYLTTSGAVQ